MVLLPFPVVRWVTAEEAGALALTRARTKVYFEAGRMVIEDLGSLNGTFVNDLRVERSTLHDGDNTIELVTPALTGVASQISFVRSISIQYPQSLNAAALAPVVLTPPRKLVAAE